ncbi:hypothetical protein [Nocardia sp. NPDC050793]|uniref:hypothetical protein n=1 Tax=Nocardia sp. NPDC050793 TaxID=3155159 RepID=UPI0033D03D0C
MGESEQVGHGSGIEAIIEKIAASKGRVGVEVAAGKKEGVRPLAHRMARPVRVLFYCSVFIGILLLVLLCVGVTFFGFLVFLF